MKIFAFIMAVIVLALSTVPCHCCDNCGSAAKLTDRPEKHSPANEGACTGNCSPFFTCSTCPGFIFSLFYTFDQAEPTVTVMPKVVIVLQKPSSFFLNNIWQPPKAA